MLYSLVFNPDKSSGGLVTLLANYTLFPPTTQLNLVVIYQPADLVTGWQVFSQKALNRAGIQLGIV